MDDAEAILLLRTVINNGDFENYWRFLTYLLAYALTSSASCG
ncbi:hypothetical protein [Streptomyces sp. NPDC093149]